MKKKVIENNNLPFFPKTWDKVAFYTRTEWGAFSSSRTVTKFQQNWPTYTVFSHTMVDPLKINSACSFKTFELKKSLRGTYGDKTRGTILQK